MTITYYVNEVKHDAFGATDVQTARALFQASYELATGRKAGQEELDMMFATSGTCYTYLADGTEVGWELQY